MITSHMNGFVQGASTQVKGHRERAVDCLGEESSLVKLPQGSAYMERIQHYQEELRKRREEDSRGRVDVDANTSLRLKKLSENQKVGIENPTFKGKEKASTNSCPHDHAAGELQWYVENWAVSIETPREDESVRKKLATKGLEWGREFSPSLLYLLYSFVLIYIYIDSINHRIGQKC